MFMPENIKNSSRIRMISGEIENLPASISPMDENDEKVVVEQIMMEIAETYTIEVNHSPNLSRCNGDPVFDDSLNPEARIFVIGASHAVRLVGGLAEKGHNIINLAKPGWKLDSATAAEIGQKLQQYAAGKDNLIVIDPLSNSVFCGSDTDGNLVDLEKTGGRWHVPGSLTVRSKPFLKQTLQKMNTFLDSCTDCKLLLLVPIPRYIAASCCDNPEHVTNRSDSDFAAEISGELERVEELLDAWAQSWSAPAMVMSYRAVTDDPEATLADLTVSATLLWLEADPVHAAPELYAALAAAVESASEEMCGEVSPPNPKRARLESVIVRPASQVKPALEAKPARPQGWSSGKLPEKAKKPPQGVNRWLRGSRGWPRFRGGRGRGFSRAVPAAGPAAEAVEAIKAFTQSSVSEIC
jgi:hypothetical protein